MKSACWYIAEIVKCKTALKALIKGKCIFGDCEDGKVQKDSPKAINDWENAFLGDSDNGKVERDSPEAINKGKSAFWEIARMVKCKKTALKALTTGEVPFGT